MTNAKAKSKPAEKKPSDFVDKKAYGENAFKITLPHPFTGSDHAVDFAHGVGVLCMKSFSYHRPEWVNYDDEKGWQVADRVKYPLFEPLVDYFQEHKAAKIERIGRKEAEKLLDKIRTDPGSFAPKPEKPKPDAEAKEDEQKTEGDKSKSEAEKEEPKPHEKV